jgi:hypothetical protein
MMPQFGADLVFNPQFDENPNGHTARQASTVDSPWHAVAEPESPQQVVRAKEGKPLKVINTPKAARKCHFSTQALGINPAIIVSYDEKRAWIMLKNDGVNDVWIAETDSQLSVTSPTPMGWHLAAGEVTWWETSDEIWGVAPFGNSNVCIADGLN